MVIDTKAVGFINKYAVNFYKNTASMLLAKNLLLLLIKLYLMGSPTLAIATIQAGHTPIHHNQCLGLALGAELRLFGKISTVTVCAAVSLGIVLFFKLFAFGFIQFFLMFIQFMVVEHADNLHV